MLSDVPFAEDCTFLSMHGKLPLRLKTLLKKPSRIEHRSTAPKGGTKIAALYGMPEGIP